MRAALLVALAFASVAVQGVAATVVPFAASFEGDFQHALFTGRLLPAWDYVVRGNGGGALMPSSAWYAHAAAPGYAVEGSCVSYGDGSALWALDGTTRGDYVWFRFAGRVCPGVGLNGASIVGEGTVVVAGGGGRFRGAAGEGTWRVDGDALFPYVYLHDAYWDYAGVQGQAHATLRGELRLP